MPHCLNIFKYTLLAVSLKSLVWGTGYGGAPGKGCRMPLTQR